MVTLSFETYMYSGGKMTCPSGVASRGPGIVFFLPVVRACGLLQGVYVPGYVLLGKRVVCAWYVMMRLMTISGIGRRKEDEEKRRRKTEDVL